MKGEQDKILQMLEEGTISAEEAQTLLNAVEDAERIKASADWSREVDENVPTRDIWKRPFGFLMISATFWTALVIRTRGSTGITSLIRMLILMPLAFISALGAGIVYLSKDGLWLHVRIRSAEIEKITISLPFPLNILRGGLQQIKSQTDDDVAMGKIDAATEFLETVEMTDIHNPVTIDIEEEGSNIQIFLS